MKKTKVLIGLILAVMMVILPLNYSNATEYLLDEEGLIDFPYMVFSDNDGNYGGKVTIDDESGYTLYYETAEISNDKLEEFKTLYEETKTLRNEYKVELTTLETAKEKYDAAMKEENPNEAYQESTKKTYEEAEAEATEAENKYNASIEKLREMGSYNESNWKKAEDDKFVLEISKYTGSKNWVIWAKLVSSNGDISYNATVYTVEGNAATTTTDDGKKDDTVANTKISQTGEKSILFIGAGLVALTIVVYRKFRNIKIK